MKRLLNRIAAAGMAFWILLSITFMLPAGNIRAQQKREKIKNTGKEKSKGTNSKQEVNRNLNKGTGKRHTNIDNSRRNVNINIDNSKDITIKNNRNTVVRHNNYRPYNRPPYRYGNRRFYCHQPYRYHPYRPYHWGVHWHPWGFFLKTLAVTAVIFSIENQQYYYDQGVYYMASNGGYIVVQAPLGATISTIPKESQTVVVNQTTNNYYYGGAFYEEYEKGYTVVPPTAGVTVENLPEGGKEEKLGEQTYVKIGETYYQPVEIDGKKMYEVVEIGEEKKESNQNNIIN
jgi:Ni/Co efflux regulator RcnB